MELTVFRVTAKFHQKHLGIICGQGRVKNHCKLSVYNQKYCTISKISDVNLCPKPWRNCHTGILVCV